MRYLWWRRSVGARVLKDLAIGALGDAGVQDNDNQKGTTAMARILVIDDEELVRYTLREALQLAGHGVALAKLLRLPHLSHS